jgi:DNA-binding NarL/FixJ family response regulator
MTELRNTGISIVGQVPWGTHFCYFYETKQDLLDILVPYFKAGLESKEFCLWIISNSELITVEEARGALGQAVSDLDRYLAEGSIELVSHDQWFLKDGAFDFHRVANGFKKKLDEALAKGYVGMRVNGSPAWLHDAGQKELSKFEAEVDELFTNERIVASCTYPLATTTGDEIFDVAQTHLFAVARRDGEWQVIEAAEPEPAEAEEDIKRALGPIRVLLVDDHALVRAGIRALAERIQDVEVVAEAGDGAEAIRLIEELKPDLVLLDISMPETSGFDVLAKAKEFPEVSVIVLTVHDAEAYAIRALREGASGFLLKSAASDELGKAIAVVIRGETYISPELARKSLLEYGKTSTDRARLDTLSPRQREILKLVADGLNTKEIAGHLNISAKTVETHRAELMQRLNIHDVAGLVRFAIKMGLVDVE